MVNNVIELVISNIKYYRNYRKLTQEQLSEISGISKDYLSEIERGKKTPSLKRLIMIANALNIDIHKFFISNHQN